MDRQDLNQGIRDEGISKFALERVEAAHERSNKRLWIIILILLALLAGTIASAHITVNAVNEKWAKILSEYEFENYEVDMSTEGDSDAVYNYIGKDGDIYNAGTDSRKKTNGQEENRNDQGKGEAV